MTFKILPDYDFNSIFIKHVISIGAIKGSLIGMGLLLSCAGIAYLNGNVSFSLGSITIPLLLGYLIYYLLVAIFEELLFRSFALCVFEERYHIAVAILLTSILFGFAHIGNEYFNGLAMLNITLAGILFATYTLEKRNISWAIGLHFGWNFTQGTILGYQVSGTTSPGLLSAKPMGLSYFSGGNFGIESSVFCTAILVCAILYILFRDKILSIYDKIIDDETKTTMI